MYSHSRIKVRTAIALPPYKKSPTPGVELTIALLGLLSIFLLTNRFAPVKDVKKNALEEAL